MRQTIIALIVASLVALALLPWAIRATRPQPLLPEELSQARQHYEATVEAAQDGTITAIRQATSVPNIRVIGTVSGGPTAEPQSQPSATTPVIMTPDVTLEMIVIVVQSTLPVTESASFSTLPPQPDPAEATPAPVISPPPTTEASELPTPANLVNSEDTITEAQLADQIRLDAGGGSLPNLRLTITPEGIRASSTVTIFPGIEQQIEAGGVLGIENFNLVFKADYVRLNGEDVSARYRDSLESQINTSLYRLLPGRFVQSYELRMGEIGVQSGVRR